MHSYCKTVRMTARPRYFTETLPAFSRRQLAWPAQQQRQQELLHGWQQHMPAAKHKPATAVASMGRRAILGGLAPCCGCGCGSAAHRSSWYDSWFAFNMAHGMEDYEAAIAPLKTALFSQLFDGLHEGSSTGSSSSSTYNVLEVGIGTGPNFGYYPKPVQQKLSVMGLEPNPAMWDYAQQAAATAGLEQQQLQLIAADAQQMPFEPNTFDAAVVTLVLCSLPQPSQALSELLRVLKPGGRLLLIEHVMAPSLGWLQVQQRLLNPLQQLLADNCHLTRNTAAVVQGSGFEAEALQSCDVGSVAAAADKVMNGSSGLLRFEVDGMGLIRPHIAGILQKPLV